MREWAKRYFTGEEGYANAGILLSIFYISGIYGFIYETIFYYFNDGMILKRGTTFGPYIQLYCWGGLLIFAVSYAVRKRPWLVFLNSGLACGVLEFLTGYCLYHFMDGFRPWDYNTEIWNWGNIGGFVCFRSVAFFAISGLLLMYVIIPTVKKMIGLIGARRFFMISAVIAAIVLCDIFYNDVLAKMFPLYNALTFYETLGFPH